MERPLTRSRDMHVPLEEAIALLDQVLDALTHSSTPGREGVALDGIEYQLRELARRLQSIHDDMATEGERHGFLRGQHLPKVVATQEDQAKHPGDCE
jgi:hypothetical protein